MGGTRAGEGARCRGREAWCGRGRWPRSRPRRPTAPRRRTTRTTSWRTRRGCSAWRTARRRTWPASRRRSRPSARARSTRPSPGSARPRWRSTRRRACRWACPRTRARTRCRCRWTARGCCRRRPRPPPRRGGTTMISCVPDPTPALRSVYWFYKLFLP